MARIKSYGRMRSILGEECSNIKIEGEISLEDFLKQISGREVDLIRKSSVILINGRNCIFTGGLRTLLKDEDLIEILPLVPGG